MKMRLVITINLFIFYGAIFAQSTKPIDIQAWSADLDYLDQAVKKIVPDFNSRVEQKTWTQSLEQLKENLPEFSEDQIVLAIQKQLVTIQDEGCTIYPFQEKLHYSILPIKTYWWEGALNICAASEPYSHLINNEITAINGVKIQQLHQQMQAYIPGDNPHYKKYAFSFYAQIPAWLEAAGLTIKEQGLTLTLGSGTTQKVAFDLPINYTDLERPLPNLRQFNQGQKQAKNVNYWSTYSSEEELLFVQLLQVRDSEEGPSFKAFIKTVEKQLNSNLVTKMVIDNRYGGGGNGFKLKPLVDLLQQNEKLQKKGRLFVLTSRATRGTLMELTALLETNTKAIIVGEPTSEGPNTVGDTKTIELPNSGLKVNLTHKFWPTSWKIDTRKTLSPHLPITYQLKDFLQKRDPWLQTIIDYQEPNDTNSFIPEQVLQELPGKYQSKQKEVKIFLKEKQLYASTKAKLGSFFKFQTQLYFLKPGVLSTDIPDVFFHYKLNRGGKIVLQKISWKGQELSVET